MINSGFAINIPQFYCYVRAEYLYNLELHKGETIPCLVFGADSIFGRATGFDILIDNGAMFARLPISALVHKTDAPDIPLDHLQLWNNFSYLFEAVEYTAIRGIDCEVRLQDDSWYCGNYMFTFSWYGNPYAEDPGEGGFKRAHMIALENGCYTLQPNNRVRWFEMSFITKPFPEKPDYKTNEHVWVVENRVTEDSDKYFYDVKDNSEKDTVRFEKPCINFVQSVKKDCSGSILKYNTFFEDHFWCYACGKCTFSNCTNFKSHA